jgi:radical SAM protein with 4Fe4S-binding SPASM domain
MERPDLYEIIKYAKEKGLRIMMATCGYLLDDDSIAKLKKAGVSSLSFSIDGATAETHDHFRDNTGAFDIVIKAAQLARKVKMPFQINTTIHKQNAGEIIGIAELAKRLGAISFNTVMLVPTGPDAETDDAVLDPVQYEYILNELIRIKMKKEIEVRVTCGPAFARICEQAKERGLVAEGTGCMGGRGSGFISFKGDVQTCGVLNIPAGNLIDNNYNFAKIWRESILFSKIRDTAEFEGKCGECEYVEVCGGCKARAMTMMGNFLAGDPLCGYLPKRARLGSPAPRLRRDESGLSRARRGR